MLKGKGQAAKEMDTEEDEDVQVEEEEEAPARRTIKPNPVFLGRMLQGLGSHNKRVVDTQQSKAARKVRGLQTGQTAAYSQCPTGAALARRFVSGPLPRWHRQTACPGWAQHTSKQRTRAPALTESALGDIYLSAGSRHLRRGKYTAHPAAGPQVRTGRHQARCPNSGGAAEADPLHIPPDRGARTQPITNAVLRATATHRTTLTGRGLPLPCR